MQNRKRIYSGCKRLAGWISRNTSPHTKTALFATHVIFTSFSLSLSLSKTSHQVSPLPRSNFGLSTLGSSWNPNSPPCPRPVMVPAEDARAFLGKMVVPTPTILTVRIVEDRILLLALRFSRIRYGFRIRRSCGESSRPRPRASLLVSVSKVASLYSRL